MDNIIAINKPIVLPHAVRAEDRKQKKRNLTLLVGIMAAFGSVSLQLSMDMGFLNPKEKLELVRRYKRTGKAKRTNRSGKCRRKELGNE